MIPIIRAARSLSRAGPTRLMEKDGRRAAVRKALILDQDAEVATQLSRRVSEHHVLHLADGIGGIRPGLVDEVNVRRDGVDPNAQTLESGGTVA